MNKVAQNKNVALLDTNFCKNLIDLRFKILVKWFVK